MSGNPALHCVGAVMYLFEGSFGRVLHTGDFRWELDTQSTLCRHPSLVSGALDRLYLDNTFCNPRHNFPSRLEACGLVLEIIKAHPEHDILLGVDSLGKEELLCAIASSMRTRIGVLPDRMKPFQLLGLPQHVTAADDSARIHVLPKWQVTAQLLATLNRVKPTVGIIPSAFAGSKYTSSAAAQQQQSSWQGLLSGCKRRFSSPVAGQRIVMRSVKVLRVRSALPDSASAAHADAYAGSAE
ncbi:hypothetical protein WJX72_009600 [[Myrmecia] bisecta]|uniref:Uncharacterized protein n=1 Tax=[Myrmecia] bisecta TaxID=41462 RepID=A0AAW1QSC1_9CHLO